MDINAANLGAIFTGLSTAYNHRFESTETFYNQVAMTVPSTTAMNEYPRFDDIPGIREWVGDRAVYDVSAQTYIIRNKEFEGTIGIKRAQIEDDQIGLFSSMAAELGQNAAEFPDQLVFPLLAKGETTICYDGQNFFDDDHPGWDEEGDKTSVSNFTAGANPPWYLVDDSRVVKPIVFQSRKPFKLVAMDKEDDQNVFNKGQFQWGVDGRCNAGFGLWQLMHKSKAALTAANYAAARNAMGSIRKRSGQVINIRPMTLLVPPSLEAEGRQLLEAALVAGGDSNIWAGTAKLSVIPLLG